MRSRTKHLGLAIGLACAGGLAVWASRSAPPPLKTGPDPAQVAAARALLAQVHLAYAAPVTLAVDYQVLPGPEGGDVLDSQRGLVVRQDDLQYWRIGDVEVLQTEGLIASADPGAQELTVRDAATDAGLTTDAASLAATVERQLSACLQVTVDRSERGLQRINLDCPASRFTHIELEIAEPRALLSRIVLDVRETTGVDRQTEHPRMVITYQPLDAIPDDVHLNLAQLVRQQGNSLVPGGAYEGYALVDLRAR